MLIRNTLQKVEKTESTPIPPAPSSATPNGQLFMPQVAVVVPKEKKKRAPAVPVDDSLTVAKVIAELFKSYINCYKLVTTEEDLVSYLNANPELGFDTETDGLDRYKDIIAGFSVGTDKHCIYVPLNHRRGTNYTGDRSRLGELLRRNGRKYWGMNTKFDRGVCRIHMGFDIPMKWDAEIAARLLDNREEAKLKTQYILHIDPDAVFYEFGSLFKQKFTYYDPAVVGIYGGVDAMKHCSLGKYQDEKMRDHFPRIYKLMKNVELPLIDVVLDMELRGIAIDVPYYEKFTAELQADADKLLFEIQSKFPNFNPNSPKQVGEVLFDRLRLPDPSKMRKTGEEWLEKIQHPVARSIVEIRKLTKAMSTYTKAIPALAIMDENGIPIIHTTYHTIGADTGRFSSTEPNLQNQPKDNRFRRGFVARPGHMLASCDFAQQEQAILAGVSRDPKMLEGAEKGMDFYALMASIVWKLPYEECTKKGKHKNLRDRCKSIVLGVTYGMGAQSLSDKLNEDSPDHVYTVDEAEQIMTSFYSGFPVVKKFQEWCHNFAKENGYMETTLGRRRYFLYLGKPAFECQERPDVAQTLNSLKYYNQIRACLDECKENDIKVFDNRWRQGDELRQTVNHVMQGGAADQTKICMIALYRDPIFRKKYQGELLLQVHDELIAEFPTELAKEGSEYMASVMCEVGSEVIMTHQRCEPFLMSFWQKD